MLTVIGLMLTGIGLLVGCGDDKSTEPTGLITGDTLDTTFQAAEGMFGASGISQMDSLMLPFVMFGIPMIDTAIWSSSVGAPSRGIPGLRTQEEYFLTYHVLTGYWYLYASGSAMGEQY